MPKRHFPYQHPTFGSDANPKTSSHWKVSVYYWWHQYLLRNVDYLNTCASGGVGKCALMFEHFGDLTKLDFKSWWTDGDRGARLFAEPITPTIQLLSASDLAGIGFQGNNSLILKIPLNLPINYLVKNFRDVVTKHHSGKRGQRQSKKSNALFPITGKVDVAFLETALMVWDARSANPAKPWWLIAVDLRLSHAHKIKPDDPQAVVTDKKNILASTASRYYRKACQMIETAGKGRFPH